MEYLTRSLDALGLPYIPSVGNFISFEIPDLLFKGLVNQKPAEISAAEVNDQLLAAGVIIRLIANYEMPNHLRVSIGTKAENEVFVTKLTKILLDAHS
jgi:histidinol-phosphate aminotransferase